MNKVLKLSSKKGKVRFKLLFPEAEREVEVPKAWFRSFLERFTTGVRIAYLRCLKKLDIDNNRVDTSVFNSASVSTNFPEEYGEFRLKLQEENDEGEVEKVEEVMLQAGKDSIQTTIRYVIEKDFKKNLKNGYRATTIKNLPLLVRVHTTKEKPYPEAFGEVFKIFEITEPKEDSGESNSGKGEKRKKVKVRIGVKLFKRTELEGRKVTPVLLVETVMKFKKKDFAKNNARNNSYYRILQRIKDGVYEVVYAGLHYENSSGLSLLIGYEVPESAKRKNKKARILGIDLGQVCPVYWCVVDKKTERRKLTNGNIPRGKLDYPINLEMSIRKLWKRKRNLLSSLHRTKDQILTLGSDMKTMKLKERIERNLRGLKRKERNLMRKMNEYLANEVVRIAQKKGCEKIRMEKLSGINKNELYFKKWNYGQLQNFIEQKAKAHKISVERVSPWKTSQRCPSCGYVGKNREEVRPSRDRFVCPECGREFFADFVGAFNVAVGGIEPEGGDEGIL